MVGKKFLELEIQPLVSKKLHSKYLYQEHSEYSFEQIAAVTVILSRCKN